MNCNKKLFIFIIILMSILGPLSTDMYLPSLPKVVDFFGTSSSLVQLTISFFLLGVSISQLLYGPLSERFSRKSILIIAMFIYIVASLGCILSTNVYVLISFRFIQAIGAAAGMTIGRSFIMDAFDEKESAKIFATVFSFVGLSPALAPIIGGYIETYLNWAYTFGLLLILGVVLLYLIIRYIPVNLHAGTKHSIHPINILKTYKLVIFNKRFIGYMLISSVAYITYFAFITESPFILAYNGFNAKLIGLSYTSLAVAYIMGNLVSRKLLSHYNLNQVLTVGYSAFLFSGFLMLVVSYFASFNMFWFLLPISILTFGNGFLIPLGTAGVLSSFKEKSGYASGLLGFLQLALGFSSSALVSYIIKGSYSKLGTYICFFTIIGFIMFYFIIIKGIAKDDVKEK